MDGKSILIVGGAGFVGSNLAHFIIENFEPKEIIIIDNLLSSTVENIPVDDRVNFLFGSVTDNELLEAIPSDIDFVFHLACFHGNQSARGTPKPILGRSTNSRGTCRYKTSRNKTLVCPLLIRNSDG